MKKPLKAALFSAFILPGAGQILLKRYYTATLFILLASYSIYSLFAELLQKADLIAEKIQSGQIGADIMSITTLVHQQSNEIMQTIHPDLMILLVVWCASIVHAYWCGKNEKSSIPSSPNHD